MTSPERRTRTDGALPRTGAAGTTAAPAAVQSSPPVQSSPAGELLGLQRSVGNRTITKALSQGRRLPLQRDFNKGMVEHKAHGQHSKEVADEAATHLEKVLYPALASVADVVGQSTTTVETIRERKQKAAELKQQVEATVAVIKASPRARYWNQLTSQASAKVSGPTSRLDTGERELLNAAVLKKIQDEGPKALKAIEEGALAIGRRAGAALRQLAAGGATERGLSGASGLAKVLRASQEALSGMKGNLRKLDSLTKEAGEHKGNVAEATRFMAAGTSSIDIAGRFLDALQRSQESVERARTTQKQRGIALGAELEEAKERAADAAEAVGAKQEYRKEFMIDLEGWRNDGADEASLAEMVNIVDEEIKTLIEVRDLADKQVVTAQKALDNYDAGKDEEVNQAKGEAKDQAKQEALGVAPGLAELEVTHHLTEKVGVATLEDFTQKLADRPLLAALLAVFEVSTLRRALNEDAGAVAAHAGQTSFRFKKLRDNLGEDAAMTMIRACSRTDLTGVIRLPDTDLASLKSAASAYDVAGMRTMLATLTVPTLVALVKDVSGSDVKKLGLTAEQIREALAEVDSAKLKVLVAELGAERVGDIIKKVKPKKLAEILPTLDAAKLKSLDLDGAKLADLLSEFTVGEITTLMADIGDKGPKDLLSEFSAKDAKQYRVDIGAPRLRVVMTTKKVKASALKHYGAAFLRTFPGVTNATMNHLCNPPGFNGAGKVSGGHDEANFRAFILGNYRPSGHPRGEITSGTAAPIYKVTYNSFRDAPGRTIWFNGHRKTLIQNLNVNRNAWTATFEEAVWKAIATKNLVAAGGNFSASVGGSSYEGYWSGAAVDTVYPVV